MSETTVITTRQSHKTVFVLVLAWFLVLGIVTNAAQALNGIRVRCEPGSFFPPGTFSDASKADESHIKWYSEYLKAAEEPSLCSTNDKTAEVYRLLWIREYREPVLVRIERHGTIARLTLKAWDKKKDFFGEESKPEPLAIKREKVLKPDEWVVFSELFKEASFWQTPTKEQAASGERGGAHWILEGIKDGSYHVVDRREPKGSYKNVCLYLIVLARLYPILLY